MLGARFILLLYLLLSLISCDEWKNPIKITFSFSHIKMPVNLNELEKQSKFGKIQTLSLTQQLLSAYLSRYINTSSPIADA